MSIKITSLADIVRRHAADRPDAPAIVHAGRKTTYAELDRAASQVANGLIAEGIKPQARVAHLDKSSDIFFELLFGVAKANAVMVSVNWRLAAPEVLHIVNDAEAEILFVGEEFFPVVEKIRDELRPSRKIVAFGARHPAWESFAAWRDRHPADRSPPAGRADRHGACSSTPAARRGCPRARSSPTPTSPGCCRSGPGPGCWRRARPTSSACRCSISAAPAGASPASSRGATNHVMREFVPAEILQTVQREQLQVMLLVPAMILFLVQAPQIRETDLSSLRPIVYGASPIPADLLRQAMEIFRCGFLQVYGLTETTGAITQLPPDDHDPSRRREAALLRQAHARVELRIVGDDGEDVADRRGRRDRGPLAADHARLLEQARGHRRRAIQRRLVLHRRRGLPRRRGLSLHLRPREGHDRVGRREHLSRRGRERAVRPSRPSPTSP